MNKEYIKTLIGSQELRPSVYKNPNGEPRTPGEFHKPEKDAHAYIVKAFRDAWKLHENMEKLKAYIFSVSDDMFDKFIGVRGLKKKKDLKTETIHNISNDLRISIKMNAKIHFDATIEIAKDIIKEYINKETNELESGIKKLIDAILNVDKNTSSNNILQLMQIDIEDPLWQEAMSIIKKSIKKDFSNRYIRFEYKDEQGEWKLLPMNFHDL